MRRRVALGKLAKLFVLASSVSAVSCAAMAAAAPAMAARCHSTGSHTLISTRTLRVYRTHTFGRGEAASDDVVACWLVSGRETVLVTESPHDENNDVRLVAVKLAVRSPSVLGVSSSTVGVGLAETYFLQSFNVRTGRKLASNETELRACEEGCRLKVFEFVVAASGALAFVDADNPGSDEPSPTGLYTLVPHGSLHLLEEGGAPREPEPGSPTITDLQWANGQLTWRSNGSPMSAPLS
jgi:hypothetical protein